ncbi:MAG TPA: ATP-binding protein, partial [Vicinamibacterales bacterium]
FAFVPKPFDLDRLFATVERALERRRVVEDNRRLVWEQKLMNDVADDLRALVEPDELAARVLRRLSAALELDASAVRLHDPRTGRYDQRFLTGPEAVREAWSGETSLLPRPSDTVLSTRQPVRLDDLHDGLTPEQSARMPLRSALGVPMLAGDALVGVLSVGSVHPRRFSAQDQQLLTVIARQVAVAVQNAQLHHHVRAAKQEWEATFDAIGDVIAVFDRHGRVLRGNTALAAHLGRSVTSLRGLSCDEVGLCGGRYPGCAVGRTAIACSREDVTLSGDRVFSVTTCPVVDVTDGVAVVQIAKDVTPEIQSARRLRLMSEELSGTNGRLLATVERLKTTQAQLLQAEKLSAIGQLVAGVAHELNNPLTSVIGYSQLLQDEFRDVDADPSNTRPPAEIATDLRRIAEESERAARIVRNLLAFARRQSAARALQDMGDVISRVLALRAYEFRLNAVDLQTDIEPDLPRVLGDGGQMQQALLNLVLNAEQAMRSRAIRSLRVGARRIHSCNAIEVFVSDSGHGIAEENLRRVFDPFFTTRAVGEGTGLGLSICYGIVRDHGGQIAVQSRVGVGTTFSLLLPAHADAAQPLASALVAHREPTERDYVAAALTGWGYPVAAAESAADARAKLRAGGIGVALIDRTLVASEPDEWKSAVAAGGAEVVLMADAEDVAGPWSAGDHMRGIVRAPFELAALQGALRGISQEMV